jgi:hypothetical protein
MPFKHTIWRVGQPPVRIQESSLATEKLLEEMIVAAPEILSDQWMIIGRQEDTGFGGRIDLLAVAPDGALILIELKRGRTPREVVAQAIDYAVWLEGLDVEEIARIYSSFAPGHDLANDFRTRFGSDLGEATLNESHQIVIVASSLDSSSERIVGYLSQRGVSINVLSFQLFNTGTEQLLSRAWLLDPVETQISSNITSPKATKGPWNGEYYVSYGHSPGRLWSDAVKYNFVSAGGGSWYSNTLNLLKPNDRIWVKAPGHGFVGVGRVRGPAEAATDFEITIDGKEQLAVEALKGENGTNYHHAYMTDSDKMEYFVPVEWAQTVPVESAVNEIGLFGNQNTVCAPKTPKWRHTIERLERAFPKFDSI